MRTLSAHHASISLSARAWFDTDAINYAIKYTTKIKAKFSFCDQSKFNEPVLKPGTPEEQHIPYYRKLTLVLINVLEINAT